MATFAATDINSKPLHGCEYGNQNAYDGVANVLSTVASGDTIRAVRVPAGNRLIDLVVVNEDLGGTIPCKVGYSYADGSTAPNGADTAFAAAGSTILQTAGRNSMVFFPFNVDKDIFIDIVISGAVTSGAAGKVAVIAKCTAIGLR